MTDTPETGLTIAAAAAQAGLRPAELYREVTAGRLAAMVGRNITFTTEALAEWQTKRQEERTAAAAAVTARLAGLAGSGDTWQPDAGIPPEENLEQGLQQLTDRYLSAAARQGNVLLHLRTAAVGPAIINGTTADTLEPALAPRLIGHLLKRGGCTPDAAGEGYFEIAEGDARTGVSIAAVPATDGPVITLRLSGSSVAVPGDDAAAETFKEALARPGVLAVADPDGTRYDRYLTLMTAAGGGADTLAVAIEQGGHPPVPGISRFRVAPDAESAVYAKTGTDVLRLGPSVVCVNTGCRAETGRLAALAAAAGKTAVIFLPAAGEKDLAACLETCGLAGPAFKPVRSGLMPALLRAEPGTRLEKE